MKYNKGKIFIITSIIFLMTLIIIYSCRLVYYYRLENKPFSVKTTLSSVITNPNNVVNTGDGMYESGDEYLFKGMDVTNYLYYSGRLWRIIGVNSDKSVKLVTDNIETSMTWNYEDNDYQTSYVRQWLNPVSNVEHSGIFYDSLNKPETLLVLGSWCTDVIENINKTSCDKINDTDKVGLLEIEDYKQAGGKSSYLNQQFYEWTINGYSKNQVWFRSSSGELSNNSYSGDSYYSYGVRPVINISGNITVINGDGSKEKPYIIENDSSLNFIDKKIGEYVSYSGHNWRIMDKTESTIKVLMNGYIEDKTEDPILKVFSESQNLFSTTKNDNIGYYLNQQFYKSLTNNDYIISGKWNIGEYSSDVKYDYKNVYTKTIEAKIGLVGIGDLFMNDFPLSASLTGSNEDEEIIYMPLEDGRLFGNLMTAEMKIRPALYLDGNLRVTSGNGTNTDPYIVSR